RGAALAAGDGGGVLRVEHEHQTGAEQGEHPETRERGVQRAARARALVVGAPGRPGPVVLRRLVFLGGLVGLVGLLRLGGGRLAAPAAAALLGLLGLLGLPGRLGRAVGSVGGDLGLRAGGGERLGRRAGRGLPGAGGERVGRAGEGVRGRAALARPGRERVGRALAGGEGVARRWERRLPAAVLLGGCEEAGVGRGLAVSTGTTWSAVGAG